MVGLQPFAYVHPIHVRVSHASVDSVRATPLPFEGLPSFLSHQVPGFVHVRRAHDLAPTFLNVCLLAFSCLILPLSGRLNRGLSMGRVPFSREKEVAAIEEFAWSYTDAYGDVDGSITPSANIISICS